MNKSLSSMHTRFDPRPVHQHTPMTPRPPAGRPPSRGVASVTSDFGSRDEQGGDQKEVQRVQLEHVLGMTLHKHSGLTVDPWSGMLAYPAGCVLVLLDGLKYKQLATLHSPCKTITTARFSPDGRFVVTGEAGLRPAVRVWELAGMKEVATLLGHSYGISSVAFTPRMRDVIVVGEAKDMMISVWAWPQRHMRALNKFADEIFSMAVSEDSTFFVAVGNRHIKFYYLDKPFTLTHTTRQELDPVPNPVPLTARSAILDTLMENCFCDVICGKGRCQGYSYVISKSGILIQINKKRLLERWVDTNMAPAGCLAGSESHVFVGGAGGTIRVFQSADLQILATFPRPHCLGLDIAQMSTPQQEGVRDVVYPNTHSMVYDPRRQTITVVYDNHSLYVWKASKQHGVFTKRHSRMYHRHCVWDLAIFPYTSDQDEGGVDVGALPPGTLMSISSDGTLRAWDVSAHIGEENKLKRTLVSEDCLRIGHLGPGVARKYWAQYPCQKPRFHTKVDDKPGGGGLRNNKHTCTILAVCPEGRDIAIGNRSGKISIYDVGTMALKKTIMAHDSDVTALRYAMATTCKILASGSRDRMIHVTNASRDYFLLTTLDDHSSTITAIHFTTVGQCLFMVSSSLDKSVLVRAFVDLEGQRYSFKPSRAIVCKKAVMDLTIHPWSGMMALACADRFVRVYTILSSSDSNQCFRGVTLGGGQLLKIQTDPSGHFLLTACSNKTINVLQFHTGLLLLTFYGHAETITCVRFSHNMKHIISSGTDGCIFLWRLPENMTYFAKSEMARMGRLTRDMVLQGRPVKGEEGAEVREANLLGKANLTERHEDTFNEEKNGEKVETRGQSDDIGRQLETSCSLENVQRVNGETSIRTTEHLGEGVVSVKQSKSNICQTSPNEVHSSNTQDTETTEKSAVNMEIEDASPEDNANSWCERRRIFKLEARSIHKILTVMKLVTTAMEKDLANVDGPSHTHNQPKSHAHKQTHNHAHKLQRASRSSHLPVATGFKASVVKTPQLPHVTHVNHGPDTHAITIEAELDDPAHLGDHAHLVDHVPHSSGRSRVNLSFVTEALKAANKNSQAADGDSKPKKTFSNGSEMNISNTSEGNNNSMLNKRGSLNKLTFELSTEQGQCECVGSVTLYDPDMSVSKAEQRKQNVDIKCAFPDTSDLNLNRSFEYDVVKEGDTSKSAHNPNACSMRFVCSALEPSQSEKELLALLPFTQRSTRKGPTCTYSDTRALVDKYRDVANKHALENCSGNIAICRDVQPPIRRTTSSHNRKTTSAVFRSPTLSTRQTPPLPAPSSSSSSAAQSQRSRTTSKRRSKTSCSSSRKSPTAPFQSHSKLNRTLFLKTDDALNVSSKSSSSVQSELVDNGSHTRHISIDTSPTGAAFTTCSSSSFVSAVFDTDTTRVSKGFN